MSATMPGRGPYHQIILFGDSITQNAFESEGGFSYGAALTNAYKRRFDVLNRGFSGYSTSHALPILDDFFPTTAQAQIIFFGANDACLPGDPTGHHVPLEEFQDNLAIIINHPLVKAQNANILLLTPPAIDEHMRKVGDEAKGYFKPRRALEHTKKYAEACVEVAKKLGVPVVDVWKECMLEAGWKTGEPPLGSLQAAPNTRFQDLFVDGLHLSGKGYEMVFRKVMEAIKKNYPHLDPEALPFVYQPWDKAPQRRAKPV